MILVTGATGNVGRHVVAGLLRAGVRVRAVTRNPARAALPPGAEVVHGDLADPKSFVDAFAGVSAMFLFPLAYLSPVLRDVTDVAETTPVVLAAARAGVRRVVLLGSSAALFDLERAVESSSREWTVLRPGELAVNRLADWAPMVRAGDVVRAAHPTTASAPVHERDVADVAVAALLDDGHHGRHYVLTGPRTLTIREQVAAIARGIGRPLAFEEVTPDRSRAELLAIGVPEPVIDHLILADRPVQPPLSHAVERVTGHPARTLTRWAADHAPAFAPPHRSRASPAEATRGNPP